MASNKTFTELYKRLNKEQRKAVDTLEGPVMVVAGPGTGKTEVLTLRIANILQKTDTPPDGILALTFTESGASAMRMRLLSIIGSSAYRVGIFTFHGFCNSIIQRFPDAFPRIIGGLAVDEIEQLKIITETLENLRISELRPTGNPIYYVQALKEKIAEMKRESISPSVCGNKIVEMQKRVDSIPDLLHERGAHKGKKKGKYISLEKKVIRSGMMCKVYDAYNAELERRHLYDYEDMIAEVASALSKDEDLLRILQEEFLYILADEHQDANSAQNILLVLLGSYHQNPNIFVVGDPKQAIYRFQGASLYNFESFTNEYPDATVITLLQNYRSAQNILDTAQSIISHSTLPPAMTVPLLSAKNMQERNDAGAVYPSVFWGNLENEDEEMLAVAGDIERRIGNGAHPENIAILYRYNKDSAKIEVALRAIRVAYAIESTEDILRQAAIRNMLNILRATADFGHDALLVPVLYIDFLKIDPLDIYKFFDTARKKRISLYALLKSEALLKEARIEDTQVFAKIYRQLSGWSVLSKNKSVLEVIDTIAHESGFLSDIVSKGNVKNDSQSDFKSDLKNGPTELLRNYHELFAKAQSLAEVHREYMLADFLAHIDALRKNNIALSHRASGATAGKVRLLTAHRAKGLEFEYVYIVGAVDKYWSARKKSEHFISLLPSAEKIDENLEDTEDERRLFFVACTRARKCLTITSAKRALDGRECLPTQFVEEIEKKLVKSMRKEKYKVPVDANTPMTTSVSLAESDYLRHLFLEYGLSVTALNNYLKSPWEYFFSNLLRIPKAPVRHLAFGNAVHSALEKVFALANRGERISKKEFVSHFERVMQRQPLSKQDIDDSLEKGVNALTGYFEQYRKDWEVKPKYLSELKTEFAVSVSLDIENGDTVLLRGKLDRLEVSMDGKARVVDYKTGRPKTRNDIEGKTKSSDGSQWRQLVFYKLLLDLYDNGRYKMHEGVIDFIEPDEKGKYRREVFSVYEKDVEELKRTIARVAREIQSLSFWSDPCDPEKCNYCDLVERMRGVSQI